MYHWTRLASFHHQSECIFISHFIFISFFIFHFRRELTVNGELINYWLIIWWRNIIHCSENRRLTRVRENWWKNLRWSFRSFSIVYLWWKRKISFRLTPKADQQVVSLELTTTYIWDIYVISKSSLHIFVATVMTNGARGSWVECCYVFIKLLVIGFNEYLTFAISENSYKIWLTLWCLWSFYKIW